MASRPDTDLQSETDVNLTKVSDSGYSTGCSHGQSQRSGSSKSTRSQSGSSISSSYGVCPRNGGEFTHPPASKDKDAKKKKKKVSATQEKEEMTIAEVESMETSDSGNVGSFSNEQTENLDVGHATELTHTMKAFRKMSSEDVEMLSPKVESPQVEPVVMPEFLVENLRSEASRSSSEEFFVVVSMHDGKVIYTTPTITNVLGFPKDMWLGRSFIDFIHRKDRVAFDSHITSGVAKPRPSVTSPSPSIKPSKSTIFCSLRKYRGLKSSGFGVKSKEVQYLPFQLSLTFKEANESLSDIFLVITATAVKTAYKQPEECFLTPQFSTRQLSNCVFSHVDAEAVSYLGYLPQDIVGRCIFDFYHPDDIHLIKEMYEKVLEAKGVACRSKPYRFRTQNGGYITLETEWSAFVNPWSRKLEFTIGQHCVLKGPPNPDVFAPPSSPESSFPEELMIGSKRIQDGIRTLFNQVYPNWNSETTKRHVSKSCKDLALFIKTLMEEITKPGSEQTGIESTERSISERDSVMLGEISPHHDSHSKTSTETPPSYRQLNYKENIQRFFESKPKTTGVRHESGEVKISSTDDDETANDAGSKRLWVDGSGTSGCGSGQSWQSKTQGEKSSQCGPLTMAILSKHNADMEKIMIRKHKELRSKDGKGLETRYKKTVEKLQDQNGHGVKRCGSDSWETDKVTKHRHMDPKPDTHGSDIMNASLHLKRDGSYPVSSSNFSLWPPVPAPAQPGCPSTSSGIQIAGMIPIYYINPEPGTAPSMHLVGKTPPNEHPGPPRTTLSSFPPPVDPMPLMNAFPMFGPTPYLYSPMMLAAQSQQPMPPKPARFQRPQSQATSIKGEPSSAMGSGMLSECSMKEKSLDPGEDSQSMSQDESKSKDLSRLTGDTGTGNESSSSSFSSLLKTDGSWRYSSENESGRPSWGPRQPIKKNPPWLEEVNLTPELMFRYQLDARDLANVLDSDLAALRALNQPTMVDDQLAQLYIDLELAGLSTKLKLDSDFSSSGTSSENSGSEDALQKTSQRALRRKRRHYDYGQLMMIYEENMPLPPAPSIPFSS